MFGKLLFLFYEKKLKKNPQKTKKKKKKKKKKHQQTTDLPLQVVIGSPSTHNMYMACTDSMIMHIITSCHALKINQYARSFKLKTRIFRFGLIKRLL